MQGRRRRRPGLKAGALSRRSQSPREKRHCVEDMARLLAAFGLPKKYLDFWDPIAHEHDEPSPQCLARVKREIANVYTRPPQGIFIEPEETNITKIHAVIVGPAGTPYEGGLFHFIVKCPPNYPVSPPRVRNMTTDLGRVRFNPNLYANGMICLSILGTWPGPCWNVTQNIVNVLLSIQSLLTENPYFNEPGHESEMNAGDSGRYNAVIRHETIRVAVCDAVDACIKGSSLCPPALRKKILKTFSESYDKYEKVVKENLHLSGYSMDDPFGDNHGTYSYEKLLARLQELNKLVKRRRATTAGSDDTAPSDVEQPEASSGRK
ncbi:hypothetical protein V5799_012521 [Amblyomma americanum]|uniref:Ubiquitin-conjugating enzyme E2 Z n=1 Tax=Amblyomma americanum TaxID=6943 RepID=A0AAQ4EDY5_AMBAM